jgi:hypothetical protein
MTEDLSTVRSYRSGGWFGIFGDNASVLLPPSEKTRVAELWELVDAGSDFHELLDALIASGLRGLPGFVLVSTGDEPTRIVLRGAARATFTVAGGEPVEVDGGAAATWVEKALTDVTSVRLHLEDEGGSEDYLIETGLVRVSRVDEPPQAVAAEQAPAPAAAVAPVASPAPSPAPGPEHASEPGATYDTDVHDAGDTSAGGAFAAVPVVVPLGELSEDEAAADRPADVDPGPLEPAADEAVPPTPDPLLDPLTDPLPDTVPTETVVDGFGYAEGASAEEPVGEQDEVPAEQQVDQPTERFDAVSDGPFAAYAEGSSTEEPAGGEPAAGEPEAATDDIDDEPAVEQSTEFWPFSDPAFDEAPAEVPADAAPADEAPDAAFPGEQPADGGYHAYEQPADQQVDQPADQPGQHPAGAPAYPWGDPTGNVYASPPPASPTSFGGLPVPPAAPDADHDGNTVAGGWDPNQFARQQPGIPGQPPAPSVTAQPVARLVFSNGEIVDVDRAVLIGRAPEARRFTSTDQPRLVTVPSPHQEISSTHVEVRPGSGADHGSAVVTDMGSTNGTVLTQPGLAPEDLQPGMSVQLLPGAVIDLGDGVTIQVTNL